MVDQGSAEDPAAVRERLARLARLGLSADAVGRLADLGLDDDWPRIEALGRAFDPQRALAAVTAIGRRAPEVWAALRRRARTQPDGDALARVGDLGAASDAVADLFVTDPAMLGVVSGDLEPHDTARVHRIATSTLSGVTDERERARRLALTQRRGLARIAARDLMGRVGTRAVAEELADLAEGLLAATTDDVLARAPTGTRLAVIGMGKLGGRELNYVSDIDVIFVGEGDLPAAIRAAEELLRLLGAVTPAGRAYEIDTNLRPEGRDGPLVRSLAACRTYYERWSASWESQALLKARALAGDAELGAAFEQMAWPVVWPDVREAAVIDDLQRMKGVVEQSAKVVRAGDREVKLAPGGLRDVEFAVQLLQLVHGRHDPTLRDRGTLTALAALAAGGYVGEPDAAALTDAYEFLRTVEHRLQLRSLRRTHRLPSDERDLERLAITMGYASDPGATAAERFDTDLRRVRGEVRRLHEKLFYRPLLGRFAELGADAMSVTGGLGDEAAHERLAALGFAQPEAAHAALRALASGTSRRAKVLRTLLPAVLPDLATTPEPDGGLRALRHLADRLDRSPVLLGVLRDRPVAAERLVEVLGRSPRVGSWLERQPEALALLGDDEALARRRERPDYHRVADGLVRRTGANDGASDALRRFVRREHARTAMRELLGLARRLDVAVELSALAEACLDVAVRTVTPPGVSLAVIGMGSLGGRELAWTSDLDVQLVFEPSEARQEALAAARALVDLLARPTAEGTVFDVDLGLRPEGRDGPLARTLDSARIYYERWAEPWELQALTKARPVAGDLALGRAFVAVVSDLVYRPVADPRVIEGVRGTKERMEAERVHAAGDGGLDVKLEPGGIADVEWTVQLAQLQFGGRIGAMRRRGTQAVLAVAEQEGVLAPHDVEVLREGLSFHVLLRHALFFTGSRGARTVPRDGAELDRLARLVHVLAPAAQRPIDAAVLRARLEHHLHAVRAVHDRLFSTPAA